jgi:putative ABC transport system permease protein
VFVSLKRAPMALTAHIAALPGVIDVETRVVFDVMLDVAGTTAPPTGRMIALPEHGELRMNRLYLRQGRWVEPGRDNEALVSEGFARAHQLHPGARVRAVLNGKYQVFDIVGVVLTPEYIFAIRSGELLPDDRQFGVFWIAHAPLAAAFNMEGAFNDVVLRLAPGALVQPVLDGLDRLLTPYGSLGAYGRSEQLSHRFISDEIAQQRLMATTMPPVFLGVAAFLLHVVLGRIIATQREQIAALKALGYENVTIGLHYLKFVTVITLLGLAVGLGLGIWFGRVMTRNYVLFFHFPVLAFRVEPWILLLATGVGLVAAVFAAYGAVRRVVTLAPAEAMRPPVPLVYRRSLLERLGAGQWLSPQGRMVLRSMTGRPVRALLTTCGVALAACLPCPFWRKVNNF